MKIQFKVIIPQYVNAYDITCNKTAKTNILQATYITGAKSRKGV